MSSGAGHVPLAVTTRGGAVESIHFGSVAVVDVEGTILYAAGDPTFLTFTRSALKPFQAMPLITEGGHSRFGFGPEELALACASHSGEPAHLVTVEGMLEAIGCTVEDLQCGSHTPLHYAAVERSPPPTAVYSALHHNCSGKHAAMLAYCRHCGLPHESYLGYGHPLQQAIRRVVARFAGLAEDRLVVGIDGCSAPNYAIPLYRLARAYARLASEDPDPFHGRAPQTLFAAMTGNPHLVSGERRLDLALMEAGAGDWVAKVGAEGVQAIGVRSRGWGVAIKVADGSARALHPATVEVLDQLGILNPAQRAALAAWRFPEIRNFRGTVTGGVAPAVVLERG